MTDLTVAIVITHTDAYFSPDRLFRYWLIRLWNESKPVMACIGLNPSTATETVNDPTVRKDIGFAWRNGFGGLLKLNLGAYRATDPKKWRRAPDPIGPENHVAHLLCYLDQFKVTRTVVAWGKNGRHAPEQCNLILGNIPDLYCFGCNPDGTPKHTLMLPYVTKMKRMV